MNKYLLSLLLVCVGFISFCSAGVSTVHSRIYAGMMRTTEDSLATIPIPLYDTTQRSDIFVSCDFSVFSGTLPTNYLNFGFFRQAGHSLTKYSPIQSTYSSFFSNSTGVHHEFVVPVSRQADGIAYFGFPVFKMSSDYTFNSDIDIYCTFSGQYIIDSAGGGSSSCPECPTCPTQYTSEECQSVYNLVPSSDLTSCQSSLSGCISSLSSCNSNLSGCMTNLDNYSTSLNTCSTNLNVCNTSLSSCMSSNCPSNSGAVSWSSLFVNGIQHLGAPTIRVNIPEEISRDYLSTTEDFVLDVEGYNQDTEYIESVLEVQNYIPTKEDFNNTFMLFKSFSGLIVACLFVILVFYFIKKLFK